MGWRKYPSCAAYQRLRSQEFNINIGDTVSPGNPGQGAGNIAVPGQVDYDYFTATAGQQIVVASQQVDAALQTTTLTIERPDNFGASNRVGSRYALNSGIAALTLSAGGRYRIKVEPRSSGQLGNYSFLLR